VDALDLYGRRQNLELAVIPVKDSENTNDLIIEVAKMVNVNLSSDQISTSHRLPAQPKRVDLKSATPLKNTNTDESPAEPIPSIIVRFLSRDTRNQIYGNRKLLRQADLKNFSVSDTSNIFIKENLTSGAETILGQGGKTESAKVGNAK